MSSFKAFEKRKKTLLVEYKNQFKSNKFVDKRIGENDSKLTLEDKMFKRFVAERQKRRDRKSNKYNLNDDDEESGGFDNGGGSKNDELTHLGQSIAQMEKFERGDVSDDDDEEDINRGKIGADIVSENFFGGFKEKSDQDNKKNRKDWIEEMIAKSKQAKYERQKERDRTLDLTEQLDKEWKNIMPLIGSMNKKLRDEEDEKALKDFESNTNNKLDDFDVLVKKLQYDPKGKPSDKTKSPAEMQKQKEEEAKRQEKEMRERMTKEVELGGADDEEVLFKKSSKLHVPKKAPANHQSVDDMDFNDPEYVQMWEVEKREAKRKAAEAEAKERAENGDNGEEEDGEGEEENGKEDEEENDDESEAESESEEEEDDDEEEDEEEEDDDDEEEEEQNGVDSSDNESVEDLKEEKKKSLVEEKNGGVAEMPKDKASRLNELKRQIKAYKALFTLKKLNTSKMLELTKSIYDLTFTNTTKAAKNEPSPFVDHFRELLVDVNSEYLRMRPRERRFPQLDTLFLFKLISSVFPTSDYRHQIVTPCLIIMTRYLTECPVENVGDLFRGLFLCNLCYEFTLKSKRFIPECVQFLGGLLYMAVTKASLSAYSLSTIFESFKRTKLDLKVSQKLTKIDELSLVQMSSNESQEISDKLKGSLIAYGLDLIKAFVRLNDQLVCFKEVFHVIRKLLDDLSTDNYPKDLKEKIEQVKSLVDELSARGKEYLKCLSKKPVPNKLYEPRIEAKSKFDPRHHNAVISEKQLLTRKYKKEMKSAIKEIRQDNVFLARVQLKEKLEKDAKRSQKVKEIMGSLANQEGEYQKIKRQKI